MYCKQSSDESTSARSRTVSKMDKNLVFLRTLQREFKDEFEKNAATFRDQLRKIKKNLEICSIDERQEWAEYMFIKVLPLQGALKQQQLLTALRTLVEIANDFALEYDECTAETILKEIYFQKYGKEVLPVFTKADYSLEAFDVLEYQDPWYTRLYNSFLNIF